MADTQQFFTGKLYVPVHTLKLPAEELLWSALIQTGDEVKRGMKKKKKKREEEEEEEEGRRRRRMKERRDSLDYFQFKQAADWQP